MDIIVKAGVICNAALLAFTSDIVPRWFYMYRVNGGGNLTGFTRFSLKSVDVNSYMQDQHDEFVRQLRASNVSQCWYPDYK